MFLLFAYGKTGFLVTWLNYSFTSYIQFSLKRFALVYHRYIMLVYIINSLRSQSTSYCIFLPAIQESELELFSGDQDPVY